MFRKEDLEGIIKTFIGEDGINRIKEVDGWKEFSAFSEVVIEYYNKFAENVKNPDYSISDFQNDLSILDNHIESFLNTVKIGKNTTFFDIFGDLKGRDARYMLYSYAKVVLLLAIFAKLDRLKLETKKVELITQ